MLALVAALPPGMLILECPGHAAREPLARRARAMGGDVRLFDPAAPQTVLTRGGARVVQVHAGVGWEGHDFVAAAARAGKVVVRTEHLPWLLPDSDQIAQYKPLSHTVDTVVAVSEGSQDGWQTVFPAFANEVPVHAVADGAAAPAARPNGSGGLRLLCVGRSDPQKLHRTLLVALARLHRRGVPAQLDLVGEGPGQARMQTWAARIGVSDADRILGRRDGVPELMVASDMLVLPSCFKGLPLVELEAMAIGLPVVAPDVTGTAEALGPDRPWLVPPRRSRALADALQEALGDPAWRRATARHGRDRWARKFTAGRRATDTVQRCRRGMRQRGEDGRIRTRHGSIGAGGIAHRHFRVLRTTEDVQITAAECAWQAAEATGAAAYGGHEAMLAAEDLDAVCICIPPFAHGAPETSCVAHGLPFFVEKPLSLDIARAEEIAAEGEAAGPVSSVGYYWRYLDTMNGALGHLGRNPAHLIQGFLLDQTPSPQWWWDQDRCSGQVVEQATHVTDAARFPAGDVTEVFGMSARRDRLDFRGLTVPTTTAATLRFASGAIANLSATWLLRWNHPVGLHVFADSMALEICDHNIVADMGRGHTERHADGGPV